MIRHPYQREVPAPQVVTNAAPLMAAVIRRPVVRARREPATFVPHDLVITRAKRLQPSVEYIPLSRLGHLNLPIVYTDKMPSAHEKWRFLRTSGVEAVFSVFPHI